MTNFLSDYTHSCISTQEQSFVTKMAWLFICGKLALWRYIAVWLIAVSQKEKCTLAVCTCHLHNIIIYNDVSSSYLGSSFISYTDGTCVKIIVHIVDSPSNYYNLIRDPKRCSVLCSFQRNQRFPTGTSTFCVSHSCLMSFLHLYHMYISPVMVFVSCRKALVL